MYLPKPPDDREKFLYLNPNKYFYYIPAIISGTLLFIGFTLFSTQHYSLLLFLPLVFVLFFYLFISYYIGLSKSKWNLRDHTLLLERLHNHQLSFTPFIDIYLPSCGEDTTVLRNTYSYVKILSQTTKFANEVYVLDDSNRFEVAGLAKEFGFTYITRENNDLKKAGNLRNAFKQTLGDIIVIFDADFCPRSDFLEETVPYFEDKSVAIVQTPQFFEVNYSQTPIERGAGYVQELFYRLVQRNRDNFDGAICVGTCGLYRRLSLDAFGGTAAIGYSEDLHTGYNITQAGEVVRYLPLNLSKGICPSDLKTFFYQQYRWAMGSTTLALNPNFWLSKLSFKQKMCYVSGFLYYIATSIGLILTPLPAMIMLSFFPEKIFWYNYVFSIPSLIFTTLVYASWCKSNFTMYFPVTRFIQYWAHLFAIVDKLRGNLVPWVTKNKTTNDRFFLFQLLNAVWFGLVILVIGMGLTLNVTSENWFQFSPLVLVTLYNLTLSAVTGVMGYERTRS